MKKKYTVGLYEVIGKPLVIGNGTVWPISGYIEGPIDQIRRIRLHINGKSKKPDICFTVPFEVDGIQFFGQSLQPHRIHFCHLIIAKNKTPHLEVSIRLLDTTADHEIFIHRQQATPAYLHPLKSVPNARVAICMTTYNPKMELFRRQIESIKSQTMKSWQLVISDDCSNEATFHQIQELIKHEPNMHLFRNEKNLGFYYNFEKILSFIGDQFDFVALSDQDDLWHSDKLQRLLEEIGSSELIYHDMLIKDPEGNLISKTFWNHRTNHYMSQSALMIANTVSGSATLFRQKLIKKILPFPIRIGNAFHDHWMAMCASIDHRIAYVNEALQDYIQHDSNVTGHGRFRPIRVHESTLSLLSLQRMKLSLNLSPSKESHGDFIQNNIKVYFDAYMRRRLAYKILCLRHPHWHNKRLDKIFKSNNKSIAQLLKLHLHIYSNNWKTNNAELSYINAIEVMKILQFQPKKP